MKTIYAVSNGICSDYSVVALFSTRELAQSFIDSFASDGCAEFNDIDLLPGAISLVDYVHPERAFYIFGQEDGTLGERIVKRCRDVVYVPTNRCMNLAACVNVVLYDRMAKEAK